MGTYQRYEYGQRQPTVDVLAALADYFDASLDYLVGSTMPQKFIDRGVYDGLSEGLKQFRNGFHFTQKEVAEHAHVDVGTYQNYEYG